MATHIKIEDNYVVEITRHADLDDQWDRDDTCTLHDILGFHVVGKNDYYDIAIDFDPDFDHTYFLVYVLYETGDSFGRDTGQIEFVDLFMSHKKALNVKRAIEENDQRSEPEFSIEVETETGKQYSLHCPWVGYFEYVQDVAVLPVRRLS